MFRPTVPAILCLLLRFGIVFAHAGQPESLFNGKDLEHFESISKWWRVQDGLIVGGSLTEKVPANDFLASKEEFSDFELRLELRLTGTVGFINSGIQIRSQRAPKGGEMIGYQVDVGDGWWGKLYDESRRNKVLAAAADLPAVNAAVRKGDWNRFVIRAVGPRIQSWINDVPALDYTEPEGSIPQSGRLGFQIHGGGSPLLQIRNITIERLASSTPPFKGAPPAAAPATPSPRPAVEQSALFRVPPGFAVELVAEESPGIGKFVCLNFDAQGRLWTTTAFEYPVDGNENPAAAEALYSSKGKDKVLVFDTPFATGVQRPRVFAEGLAIPLGVLAYKDGVYVQHGHDIALLRDKDGDGKADSRDVVLTGFGVQDSHLFPHQFCRAPGGWMWLAQGAFNKGKVKVSGGGSAPFDATRMARFRPDGSQFVITSQGPCNIWGLTTTMTGETWIQEANDYGYPAMPFHEFANYPGCSDRLFKPYAPQFPGTAPEFRMGGTGLSGLALSDAQGAWPAPYANVLYVANPITRQIQALEVRPEGPRYTLRKLPDFINCDDPWFRPVAIAFGPDGCLYIVDWYNQIISHNEVPRNHPERDKVRGRIWRVRHAGAEPFKMPNMETAPPSVLLSKLGGPSIAQSHLAWQSIEDRKLTELIPSLASIVADQGATPERRVAALMALEGVSGLTPEVVAGCLADANRSVRREAVRALSNLPSWSDAQLCAALRPLIKDADPEVRAQVIRTVGSRIAQPYGIGFTPAPSVSPEVLQLLLSTVGEPLAGPTAKSTQTGKPQKVREAYERDFERYLVRLHLEERPDAVAAFLASDVAGALPPEGGLLAALTLPAQVAAERMAVLLPKLSRLPDRAEVLALAQHPDGEGVLAALEQLATAERTRAGVIDALVESHTRLDRAKLVAVLEKIGARLVQGRSPESVDMAVRLVGAFELRGLDSDLVALVKNGSRREGNGAINIEPFEARALSALAAAGADQPELFSELLQKAVDPAVIGSAAAGLAASRSEAVVTRMLGDWGKFSGDVRRIILGRLLSRREGAVMLLSAIERGAVPKTAVDAGTYDRLQAVLGANNADLSRVLGEHAALFRPVLVLDGTDEAGVDVQLSLLGALTIESWLMLEPGISNADGLIGTPGLFDINFYGGQARLYGGGQVNDVIVAKSPMVPKVWTHVAFTRNDAGDWKIYIDGEPQPVESKRFAKPLTVSRIGWSTAKGGFAGALDEFRVWNRERSPAEIRAAYDRILAIGQPGTDGLIYAGGRTGGWGKLRAGAAIQRTADFPPLLSEEEAAVADKRYARFRALAEKSGNIEQGKALAATCRACHLFRGEGNSIGPDLSGVGAMGVDGILRNVLMPNAAMENAYRIYRAELRSGELIEAMLIDEDAQGLTLRIPGAPDRRVPKTELREGKFLRRSLMPEGLLDGFTESQITDLFTYLMSLK